MRASIERRTALRKCGLSARGPPEGRGQIVQDAAVVLATGVVNGVVVALCSVVRLNVPPSVPLGLYRMIDQPVARGVNVVACVPPASARPVRERGYLGPGRTQPLLKRIGAVPGDLVDLEPDDITVNGA